MCLEATARIVIAAAIVAALNSHASAQKFLTMPIDFIGEWCFSSRDENKTNYTLPSWTEDGHCKNILSIDKYSFYGENKHCEPVKIQVGKDTAPSGTTYSAIVTARCQPDGPVTAGQLQTFKFERYKGNMWITTK